MTTAKTSTIVLLAVLILMDAQTRDYVLVSIGPFASRVSSQLLAPALAIGENGAERYNITLWVRDWENKTSYAKINVTICDLKEKIASSRLSNGTGHIDLTLLRSGIYGVLVQKDNRTVGYQKIDIASNGTYMVKTWSYEVNMTLVDETGQPLANHTVGIYDQMTFEQPVYVISDEDVTRNQNYTIVTDKLGAFANQSETNGNGTLHFTGLWNGTYRLKILGKDTWVEEFVLGNRVLTLRKAAVGEHIVDIQETANITVRCIRVDMTLQLLTESDVPVANATVYVRDVPGHLFLKDVTNSTGSIERKNLYVIDGPFTVSAYLGYRAIAYSVIDIAGPANYTLRSWTSNLTVTCLDMEGNPLPDYAVSLYDQIVFYGPANFTTVTNQTETLLNRTRTDENGMAQFTDLLNGTYWIRVTTSDTIGERLIDLQKPETIAIVCNRTFMVLRFLTYLGEPLPGAAVFVFDSSGNLVFREPTDENGMVSRRGIPMGNYTVNVEWMRTQVYAGVINISVSRDNTIRCMIYKLTILCADQSGSRLSKADVNLRKGAMRGEAVIVPISLDLETDESGSLSILLPYGYYMISCSSGIYEGSAVVTLNSDQVIAVVCGVKSMLLFSILMLAVPLFVFTLLLERRRLRTPLEVRRQKNLLSKLDFMYRNGQVEYKVYRKLREEYEAKLMELGGREMR